MAAKAGLQSIQNLLSDGAINRMPPNEMQLLAAIWSEAPRQT
jgi:hypothetical protein